MDISQIKTYLTDPNSEQRLKAILELKNYEAEEAVPILLSVRRDPEFLVRSFVAMGLGKKRTAEAFAALLEMMKFDRDPNVRAEASNSLSLFGEVASPHLSSAFFQDDHWLVRRSILAGLLECNCPEELYEVCVCGANGEDETVQEAAIEGFGFLVGTSKQEEALSQLLERVNAPYWRVRVNVAKTLSQFDSPQAQEALLKLKQDEDYRVVAAALESLVQFTSDQ